MGLADPRNEDIAAVLQRARSQNRITIRGVVAQTGVSRSTIEKWFDGARIIPVWALGPLSRAGDDRLVRELLEASTVERPIFLRAPEEGRGSNNTFEFAAGLNYGATDLQRLAQAAEADGVIDADEAAQIVTHARQVQADAQKVISAGMARHDDHVANIAERRRAG